MLESGSVVVFFFPKAFTPGCTREAKEFGKEFETLKASGSDVIGVSSDTQETNDRFRESLGLPFRLVGDPRARSSAPTTCAGPSWAWPSA